MGAMDVCARGFKAASAMIEDGGLEQALSNRYSGWRAEEGEKMLGGGYTLEQIAEYVEKTALNPQPRSGQQEILENYVNRFV